MVTLLSVNLGERRFFCSLIMCFFVIPIGRELVLSMWKRNNTFCYLVLKYLPASACCVFLLDRRLCMVSDIVFFFLWCRCLFYMKHCVGKRWYLLWAPALQHPPQTLSWLVYLPHRYRVSHCVLWSTEKKIRYPYSYIFKLFKSFMLYFFFKYQLQTKNRDHYHKGCHFRII